VSYLLLLVTRRERRKRLLCNRSDLRDFSRIQERICGTAECGPDIEGDDELSRGARVTGAGCIHDRSKRGDGQGSWSFDGRRP
jgi:hypothetical protein